MNGDDTEWKKLNSEILEARKNYNFEKVIELSNESKKLRMGGNSDNICKVEWVPICYILDENQTPVKLEIRNEDDYWRWRDWHSTNEKSKISNIADYKIKTEFAGMGSFNVVLGIVSELVLFRANVFKGKEFIEGVSSSTYPEAMENHKKLIKKYELLCQDHK